MACPCPSHSQSCSRHIDTARTGIPIRPWCRRPCACMHPELMLKFGDSHAFRARLGLAENWAGGQEGFGIDSLTRGWFSFDDAAVVQVGLPHRGFTRALDGDDVLVVPELLLGALGCVRVGERRGEGLGLRDPWRTSRRIKRGSSLPASENLLACKALWPGRPVSVSSDGGGNPRSAG